MKPYARPIVKPRVVVGDYESIVVERIEAIKVESILSERILSRLTAQ